MQARNQNRCYFPLCAHILRPSTVLR